jgi:hypothetical protein
MWKMVEMRSKTSFRRHEGSRGRVLGSQTTCGARSRKRRTLGPIREGLVNPVLNKLFGRVHQMPCHGKTYALKSASACLLNDMMGATAIVVPAGGSFLIHLRRSLHMASTSRIYGRHRRGSLLLSLAFVTHY